MLKPNDSLSCYFSNLSHLAVAFALPFSPSVEEEEEEEMLFMAFSLLLFYPFEKLDFQFQFFDFIKLRNDRITIFLWSVSSLNQLNNT